MCEHPDQPDVKNGIPLNPASEQIALMKARNKVVRHIYGPNAPVDQPSKEDAERFSSIVYLIGAATNETSEGGERITESERRSILNLPRPSGLSIDDLLNLIARLEALLAGEVPASGLDLEGLRLAIIELLQVVEELQSRGWVYSTDGFKTLSSWVSYFNPQGRSSQLHWQIGGLRGSVPLRGLDGCVAVPRGEQSVSYYDSGTGAVSHASLLFASACNDIPFAAFQPPNQRTPIPTVCRMKWRRFSERTHVP